MARIGKVRLNAQINPDDLPKRVYLRPRQLAAFVGVSLKTVYKWCRLKKIGPRALFSSTNCLAFSFHANRLVRRCSA